MEKKNIKMEPFIRDSIIKEKNTEKDALSG